MPYRVNKFSSFVPASEKATDEHESNGSRRCPHWDVHLSLEIALDDEILRSLVKRPRWVQVGLLPVPNHSNAGFTANSERACGWRRAGRGGVNGRNCARCAAKWADESVGTSGLVVVMVFARVRAVLEMAHYL